HALHGAKWPGHLPRGGVPHPMELGSQIVRCSHESFNFTAVVRSTAMQPCNLRISLVYRRLNAADLSVSDDQSILQTLDLNCGLVKMGRLRRDLPLQSFDCRMSSIELFPEGTYLSVSCHDARLHTLNRSLIRFSLLSQPLDFHIISRKSLKGRLCLMLQTSDLRVTFRDSFRQVFDALLEGAYFSIPEGNAVG